MIRHESVWDRGTRSNAPEGWMETPTAFASGRGTLEDMWSAEQYLFQNYPIYRD